MRAGLLTHATKGRVALALAGLAIAGALLLGGASPGTAAPSSGIVVNEVYGGGGNSGATYKNDFIELRNRGTAAVSVDGWSVQYHAATGTGSWQVTQLSGSIPAGGIYLVAEAQGTGGTTDLPTPQATGTIAMGAGGGTVAHVNGTAALTCQDSATCPSAAVDLVGYGNAGISETAPIVGASAAASVQRKDAADTDDNANDFTAGAPTPGAATAGGGDDTGDGEPGPLRIHDIQARVGSLPTGASRSPTCRASSPASAPPAAAAGTGSRTPTPTRARPRAKASSSSPPTRACRPATRSSCPAP
jgi:uncharacterized protein